MENIIFKDRADAGKRLAAMLSGHIGKDTVVYALPRGGVVLGAEIALAIGSPLDLIVSKKIGHPFDPEFALCAIASDGDILCDEAELAATDKDIFEENRQKEKEEAERRERVYLGKRERPSCEGKTAIIVDDGVATGLSMLLAIKEVKHRNPKRVVVAVPVAPHEFENKVRNAGAELVAVEIPRYYLGSVGAYYSDFPQVEDDEVISLMQKT